MAEKIMNSRYFLGNLSSLAEVYPLAMSAVDKIKEYGKVALPKIQENCLKNKRRIEDCKRAIQALEDKIKILEYKKAEREKLIDAIYEQQKAEKFRSTVYREYEEEHPEYRQIKEDISTAEQRVKALRYEIHTREVYIIGKLEECISTLDE
jgi:predicted  nucleic acid-binding Zn-ribbon protein